MWSTNLNPPKRRRSTTTATMNKKTSKSSKTSSSNDNLVPNNITDTEFISTDNMDSFDILNNNDQVDNSPPEDHYVCFLWDTTVQRVGLSMYSTQSGNLSIASCACTNINDCLWIASSLKQTIPTPVLILTSSTIPDIVRNELCIRIMNSNTDTPIGTPNVTTTSPSTSSSTVSSSLPSGSITSTIPIKILKQQAFHQPTAYQIVNMLTTAEWIRNHPDISSLNSTTTSSTSTNATFSNRLGSIFDFSDTLIVRTTAALVSFLVRSGILNDDSSPTTNTPLISSNVMDVSIGGSSLLRTIRLPGSIRIINLADFMFIDTLSFSALNIFSSNDKHHTKGGSSSSSSSSSHDFSLFTLLNHTHTGPGKQLLRSWLMRPTINLEIINHRHDAVEFLQTAQQQCPDIWKSMIKALQRIKDVSRILNRIATVRATFADWYALESTALAGSMVRDALITLASTVTLSPVGRSPVTTPLSVSPLHLWMNMDTPASPSAPLLLRHLILECNDQLGAMVTMLDGIIDWSSTREQGRMIPQSGLDTTLDDYRCLRDNMTPTLIKLSQSELTRLPALNSLAYTYLPQIGFVIAINKEENGLLGVSSTASSSVSDKPFGTFPLPPGTADSANTMLTSTSSLHIASLHPIANHARVMATIPTDWTLCFETDTTLHYRNDQCLELDNSFGDISSSIRELETSIIRQLENKIFDTYEPLLLALHNHLAEFDVLVSFAIVADQHNYSRPRMVPEPVMYIKNARHPLQESTLPANQSFIPNDIALAPGKSNTGPIAIITGPNYSGKSVYLKMVGILPIMAQIGCFIPAERAIMGYIDRIFSRIHSLESAVLVNQSSFTIDVNQVGFMLRHYTPRSLLLIDEFGKGTSSLDGVALLSATIRYLIQQANRLSNVPLPTDDEENGTGTSTTIVGQPSRSRGATGNRTIFPPKTIITTHFREMFDYDLLTKNILSSSSNDNHRTTVPSYLTFLQMEVMFESSGGPGPTNVNNDRSNDTLESTTPDNVIPLFKLIIGQSLSSYGLACARRGGIPEPLILRAQTITESLRNRVPIQRYTSYYTATNIHGPNYRNNSLLPITQSIPVSRPTSISTSNTTGTTIINSSSSSSLRLVSRYYQNLIFTDTLMRTTNWLETANEERTTTKDHHDDTHGDEGDNGADNGVSLTTLLRYLDLPFSLGKNSS